MVFPAIILFILFITLYPVSANNPPGHASDPSITNDPNVLMDIGAVPDTFDPDGDPVVNVYNWYRNGQSLSSINMPFDVQSGSTVRDYSEPALTGAVQGATWTASGVVGGAYSFDGVNDRLSIPDDAQVDGSGAWGEFTLEFWVKTPAGQAGKSIVSKSGSYKVGFKSGVADNILYFSYTTLYSSTTYNYEASYAVPLNPGVWYHIVCTYKERSGANIYVNGEGVKINVASTPVGLIKDSTGPLYIGYEASKYLSGVVDGFKVYPERLSNIQIKQNYLDSKDGLSGVSTIVSQNMEKNELWRCEVTPVDGLVAGETRSTAEAVIGARPNEVFTLKWIGYTPATGRGVVIYDIDPNEPGEEIIHVGSFNQSKNGKITVFSGVTGNVIRESEVIDGIGWYSYPEMADLDLDGVPEILVPIFPWDKCGLHVFKYGDPITTYWRQVGPWGESTSALVVGDIDGDGYPTIFHGTTDIWRYPNWNYQSRIMAFSYDGQLLYWAPVYRLCAGGLSLADVDKDGTYELYGGDRDMYYGDGGFGRGLTSWWADNLTVRWCYPEILMSSNIPVIVDVNGDGVDDIIGFALRGGILIVDGKTGRPIRNDLSLFQLGGHYQYSVHDIDLDGNLEILIGDGTHSSTTQDVVVWDLVEWKEDFRVYLGKSYYGPMLADVDNDGNMDMVVATDEGVFVYNYEFKLIGEYHTTSDYYLIYANSQDIDGDGKMEVVVPGMEGNLYAFDTVTDDPPIRPRSEVQFFSEKRQGAAEWIPYTYLETPMVTDPSPANNTGDVHELTSLSFSIVDQQNDPMTYHVSSSPDITGGTVSQSGLGKGRYSVPIVAPLLFNTEYRWTVEVTDGTNTAVYEYRFTSGIEDWYNQGWSYRKTITVNQAKVTGTHLNFTMLLSINDPDLAAKANPDGSDIMFTDTGYKKLAHEIEKYGDGELLAWVKVPTVSSSAPSQIYMYYGNPSAGSQEDPSLLWDNYGMAMHLNKTGGYYPDSASGFNGTGFGDAHKIRGLVEGAVEFDGDQDYIEVQGNSQFSGFTSLTVSVWMKLDANKQQVLVHHNEPYLNSRGFFLEYAGGGGFRFFASPDGFNTVSWENWGNTINIGQWYYIVVTWEPNAVPKLYINGVQRTFAGAILPSLYDNMYTPIYLGARYTLWNKDRYFDGVLDEVQVAKFAKSGDWVKTEYANILDPASFAYIDGEEPINNKPIVTAPIPTDGATGIPVTTSQVSFQVTDADGDTVDWTVTTDPDVGTGSGSGTDGRYSVTVGPLAADTLYTWTVTATDDGGATHVETVFSFNTVESLNTPPTMGPPLLTSKWGHGTDKEDLTASVQGLTDPDPDTLTSIYNWYVNGESLTLLNMPMDTEGEAVDYSPYGNDAYVVNATWSSGGVVGGYYTFDGVNDIIKIPDSDSLDGLGSRNEITIEFWVKPAIQHYGSALVYKKNGYEIGFDGSGPNIIYGYFCFLAPVEEIPGTYREYYRVKAASSLPVGVWTHVAVTYEKDVGSQIYFNGAPVTTLVVSGTPKGSLYKAATDLDLGRYRVTAYEGYYKGGLDEVMIYNRALTAEQIMQRYLETKDGGSSQSTIVHQETQVGETWYATVTPNDGETDGETGQTNAITVQPDTNLPPIITMTDPTDAETGVPVTLSQLTFSIVDPEDDPMDYTVTTNPPIGTGSGTGVGEGTYTIDVSGLAYNTEYTWTIDITDGTNPVQEIYTFITRAPNQAPTVTGPEPADGETGVPVSITELRFTLTDLDDDPMLIGVSTLPNIGDDSWVDGANGEYTVDVSGLEYNTLYTWYVNVHDGTEQINKEYTFTTEESSNVDPSVVFLRISNGQPIPDGSEVPVGTKFYMYSRVADLETPKMDLTATISYRHEGGGWVDGGAVYKSASDYWVATWVIPPGAAPGSYDVKVEVWDGDGGYAIRTDLAKFTVVATADEHALTVNIEGSGSVALDPTGGLYDEDTLVSLLATPASDWEFTGWSGALTGDTNPETVTMDGDKTVTAIFTVVVYDDVVFDSSFEMGNLKNMNYYSGDSLGGRYYTAEIEYTLQPAPLDEKHWWYYYSMEYVQGKTVTVELQNLAPKDFTGGRWPNMEPV